MRRLRQELVRPPIWARPDARVDSLGHYTDFGKGRADMPTTPDKISVIRLIPQQRGDWAAIGRGGAKPLGRNGQPHS
jgi:hypothetical protein